MTTFGKRLFSMLASALLIAGNCHPQGAATSTLRSGDLRADFAILRSAYEQLHPGLYRYNSKAEMDADFAALKLQLSHDQTLQDAFIAFSQFAAKVRCGHTQANPFNQNKPLIDALFKKPMRLPFYFEWFDRHMVVTRDFTTDHTLAPGTEVMSIDGVSVAKILRRLLSIARADGSNDSKRIAQLSVNGDSEYETFDIYHSLFYPMKRSTFVLHVARPRARSSERVTVRPLTFEQRVAPIKERELQRKSGDEALFEWKYLADGSAYLRMPTWALYNSKWNWKSWLAEHLDDAAEHTAPGLILDLRGNEGGEDVGNEIIAHLVDGPIALSSMRRLVRYRKVPEDLVPYLDTWDKSFRDWGESAADLTAPWPTAPTEVRYLRLTRYDDDVSGEIIRPSGKRFRGKVVVLIDAVNSSATFQFVQNIQSHGLGTLVGQPTGGSQRGINGGAFFFLRLPHSGIELDLPVIGTFPLSPAPDAGITPDILVKVSVEDIAGGRDAGLLAAMHVVQF